MQLAKVQATKGHVTLQLFIKPLYRWYPWTTSGLQMLNVRLYKLI